MSRVPEQNDLQEEFISLIKSAPIKKVIAIGDVLEGPFIRHIAQLDITDHYAEFDWMDSEALEFAVAHLVREYGELNRDGRAARVVYQLTRERLLAEKRSK